MSLPTFLGVDTFSPGKQMAVAFQTDIINDAHPQGFNGYCLGLPGTGAQCDRHIVEYSKYGIDSRKKIFVDYDYSIHRSHRRWKETTNLRVKLIYGSIRNVLDSEWKAGKQIDVIDYDGTSLLDSDHIDVLQNAALNDTKVVIIVVTTRAPFLNDDLEYWKQRLDIQKEWLGPSKGWRNRVRKITEGALRTTAEECGFDYYFLPYPGRKSGAPPMLSCVFINRKFIDF